MDYQDLMSERSAEYERFVKSFDLKHFIRKVNGSQKQIFTKSGLGHSIKELLDLVNVEIVHLVCK